MRGDVYGLSSFGVNGLLARLEIRSGPEPTVVEERQHEGHPGTDDRRDVTPSRPKCPGKSPRHPARSEQLQLAVISDHDVEVEAELGQHRFRHRADLLLHVVLAINRGFALSVVHEMDEYAEDPLIKGWEALLYYSAVRDWVVANDSSAADVIDAEFAAGVDAIDPAAVRSAITGAFGFQL